MMGDVTSLQSLIAKEIDNTREKSLLGNKEIVAKGWAKKGLRILYRYPTHNSAESLHKHSNQIK